MPSPNSHLNELKYVLFVELNLTEFSLQIVVWSAKKSTRRVNTLWLVESDLPPKVDFYVKRIFFNMAEVQM